jgi:hypothetical protein
MSLPEPPLSEPLIDWLAELDWELMDDELSNHDAEADSLDTLLADDSLDEEDSLTDENDLLEP